MIAPFLLGYSADRIAVGVDASIGFLLIVSSYLEAKVKDKGVWEYELAIISGFATILAPFVLIFQDFSRAIWLSSSIGILLVLLGSIRLYSGRKYIKKNILLGGRKYEMSQL